MEFVALTCAPLSMCVCVWLRVSPCVCACVFCFLFFLAFLADFPIGFEFYFTDNLIATEELLYGYGGKRIFTNSN